MTWREVTAYFDQAPADWSPAIEAFRAHGCENTIQTDHPPSLGAAVVELDETDRLVQELSRDLIAAGASRIETRPLVEENWDEIWKQFFKPRRIGPRIVVRPTWESFESSPADIEVVLDPGQAFGTGDHPTTRLCLALMQQVECENARVADVGCGSGILAIAAKKLGASFVEGVDIEPLSVAVARENAKLNDVEIRFTEGRSIAALSPGPYDLILSNIISATLIGMAGAIAPNLTTNGRWIVSGILEANWPDVLAAARSAGLDVVEMRSEDDWVAAILGRN
jgi:ribosomal protein L11 methyltransferase